MNTSTPVRPETKFYWGGPTRKCQDFQLYTTPPTDFRYRVDLERVRRHGHRPGRRRRDTLYQTLRPLTT